MDIKTKFDIDDTCYFLQAHDRESTDIRVIEATVTKISFVTTQSGPELLYEITDDRGRTMELDEDILCKNHQELIQHLFSNQNVRTFLNGDHKIRKNKESERDEFLRNAIYGLPHMARDGGVNMDDLFTRLLDTQNDDFIR